MVLRLFVRCKNATCDPPGQQIFLPPAVVADVPPPIPQDIFPLRAVCRECGQWSTYTAIEADWAVLPARHQTMGEVGPRSWCVRLKCDYPGCDSVTTWYLRDDSGLDTAAVVKRIYKATPEIVCDRLHPLHVVKSRVIEANYS